MNETLEQPVTEIVPDQPEAAPSLSIMEHAAKFGPSAEKPAELVDEPAQPETGADLKPIRPVDQQRRDQGKFAEGRQRLKAKDAVARINELTGRAKTAEEKLAAAEAELTKLRSQSAPRPDIARAEQRVEQAQATAGKAASAADPEPTEDDPKFGGDYGKYLAAHARWAARDEYRQIQAAEQQRVEESRRREQYETTVRSWQKRVTDAKSKYPDFEQVAFGPTNIPTGSVPDAFIMEDDAGAEILYHLQTHPEELDSLLRMPVLAQTKHLALLSQRLLSSSPGAAGETGAAPERPKTIVLPPRPPTPVRTEAQRSGDVPPMDRPLSIAEHQRHFGPKVQRR